MTKVRENIAAVVSHGKKTLNAVAAAAANTNASRVPVSKTLASSLMRPPGNNQTLRPSAIRSAIAGISVVAASSKTMPTHGRKIAKKGSVPLQLPRSAAVRSAGASSWTATKP